LTTKSRVEEKIQSTDEAKAVLARLKKERNKAVDDLVTRRNHVKELEVSVGERLVDARLADDAKAEGAAQSELVAARADVEIGEKMIGALDRRIVAAQKDVHIADAHAMRQEAARLWREVEPRLSETNALLDSLAEREGVRWLPWPVAHPSGACLEGSWQQTKTGELLVAIIEAERGATHLESVAGIAPGPSCLLDVNVYLHLGSGGVLRASGPIKVGGSQLLPEPTTKPTPKEVAQTYIDALPNRARPKLEG